MSEEVMSAGILLIELARLRTQFAACLLANNEVALLNADYMIALQRIADTRGDCVGAEMRAIAEEALQGIAPDPPF